MLTTRGYLITPLFWGPLRVRIYDFGTLITWLYTRKSIALNGNVFAVAIKLFASYAFFRCLAIRQRFRF